MNRKQFILLIVLVVVLGFAGLHIYNKQQNLVGEGNPAIGQKLLGDLPVNDVAHIALKQGTNELNLVKKDDLWRVRERNNYPANFSEISDFLLKVKDLKIVQSEKAGVSDLTRLELVAGPGTNAALTVDLKDQSDKSIKTLLLGKKHMRKSNRNSPSFGGEMEDPGWPDGRWVKVGGSSDSVALISEAFANIEPKPESWLNKDFFKVEKIKSVSVTYPDATNSFKVARDTETAEWKLADHKPGEQLDSTKTSSLASCSPTFSDVATEAKPEQLGLDKPTVATLDTFDNFTYTLKVGQKTNENYPLTMTVAAQLPKERTPGKDEKPEDKAKLDKTFKDEQKKLEDRLTQEKNYEKWVYLVSAWTLDSVLKQRGQLLQEKKEEKTAAAAATSGLPKGPEPILPPATNGFPALLEPAAQPGTNAATSKN
jgi:hypothetical protein